MIQTLFGHTNVFQSLLKTLNLRSIPNRGVLDYDPILNLPFVLDSKSSAVINQWLQWIHSVSLIFGSLHIKLSLSVSSTCSASLASFASSAYSTN